MTKPEKTLCSSCPLGPPDWLYLCGQCQAKFSMPAPKGPSEEKSRACPKCQSKNIKLIDTVKSEACPPGG
jgi:DNA-directed RNA polymerase subunit RPC12/RpoP